MHNHATIHAAQQFLGEVGTYHKEHQAVVLPFAEYWPTGQATPACAVLASEQPHHTTDQNEHTSKQRLGDPWNFWDSLRGNVTVVLSPKPTSTIHARRWHTWPRAQRSR